MSPKNTESRESEYQNTQHQLNSILTWSIQHSDPEKLAEMRSKHSSPEESQQGDACESAPPKPKEFDRELIDFLLNGDQSVLHDTKDKIEKILFACDENCKQYLEDIGCTLDCNPDVIFDFERAGIWKLVFSFIKQLPSSIHEPSENLCAAGSLFSLLANDVRNNEEVQRHFHVNNNGLEVILNVLCDDARAKELPDSVVFGLISLVAAACTSNVEYAKKAIELGFFVVVETQLKSFLQKSNGEIQQNSFIIKKLRRIVTTLHLFCLEYHLDVSNFLELLKSVSKRLDGIEFIEKDDALCNALEFLLHSQTNKNKFSV